MQVQTTQFSYQKQVSQSNSWELSVSTTFSYSITNSFKVSVPLVAEVSTSVTMGFELTTGFKQTSMTTTSTTETYTQTVNINPCTDTLVTGAFWEGTGSIPFMAIFEYTDGTSESVSGTWTGVSQSDAEVKTEVQKQCLCKDPTTGEAVCGPKTAMNFLQE